MLPPIARRDMDEEVPANFSDYMIIWADPGSRMVVSLFKITWMDMG
jgi:hypothetical protein